MYWGRLEALLDRAGHWGRVLSVSMGLLLLADGSVSEQSGSGELLVRAVVAHGPHDPAVLPHALRSLLAVRHVVEHATPSSLVLLFPARGALALCLRLPAPTGGAAVVVGGFAIFQVTNMVDPEVLVGPALPLLRKTVVVQTGGVTTEEAAPAVREVREGSDYGPAMRLKNNIQLL